MKIVETSIIYDNPLPQLRSRHSFFPSVCQCADGSLLTIYYAHPTPEEPSVIYQQRWTLEK